ncbi:MAG TPA: helix-turn-helix transcriptional regulator [Pyrinomonadaceae bacterium]|jgi:transcriptional regulator with XRE-family HTH domain
MGKKVRERPERLAEKLLRIRHALGLSQNKMIRKMELKDKIVQADISDYERGRREPSLKVPLEYARAANVYADVLIDDNFDLPERLPTRRKSMGTKRAKERKRRRR